MLEKLLPLLNPRPSIRDVGLIAALLCPGKLVGVCHNSTSMKSMPLQGYIDKCDTKSIKSTELALLNNRPLIDTSVSGVGDRT